MNKFSKFLENNEELLAVIKHRPQNWLFYLLIFLGLPLIFFFLYPLGRIGRQGMGLWFFLVILLLLISCRQLLKQRNVYLLTDQKIIYLQARGENNYLCQGKINLYQITDFKKHKRYNLCLVIGQRRFYLLNIKSRDYFYNKIKDHLI